jgi:hypothetical protein
MPHDPIFDGLNYGVDYCLKHNRWLGAAEVWHCIDALISKHYGAEQ